ncbi:hypothetical protein AAFF_G00329320 [Aldrovandia affinis]|uniref:Uncharacterized protein n=1 Tax=Aldrovandia affinis TaxID=143900 RepID=A0AAD7WPU5_9TELE|nr:hypothetical protein AAFF_G00329320 [Aldrovandia affinis]
MEEAHREVRAGGFGGVGEATALGPLVMLKLPVGNGVEKLKCFCLLLAQSSAISEGTDDTYGSLAGLEPLPPATGPCEMNASHDALWCGASGCPLGTRQGGTRNPSRWQEHGDECHRKAGFGPKRGHGFKSLLCHSRHHCFS